LDVNRNHLLHLDASIYVGLSGIRSRCNCWSSFGI